MTQDMKTTLTRLFTVMMLIIVSMGAMADVKVLYGEKGESTFKSDGGTIEVKQEVSKKDATKITVFLIVTPNKGYTMQEKNSIEAYATAPTNIGKTRAPQVSERLTFDCDDFKDDTSARTYYVDIDPDLALWVKSADFQKEEDNGRKSAITGEQDDYSGVYYIASRDYVEANTTTNNNFYLCPTEKWAYYQSDAPYYYVYSEDRNTDTPFMTTYQCRDGVSNDADGVLYDARKAIWIVEKVEKLNESDPDYYHIKRAIDGKYLTRNRSMGNSSNAGRMRIHLESSAAGDDALFEIIWIDAKSSYDIKTKNDDGTTGRQYLNATGPQKGNGNINSLQGTAARNDGPTGVPDRGVGGIIGLWTAGSSGDTNSSWHLEEVVEQPVISQAANGDVTITCATSSTTIYYTLDGSDPVVPDDGASDPTGPTYKYTTPFTPELGSTGVKAVAVLSDLHAAVSKKAERSFVAYSTPNFSFDGVDKVTISAAHADATIYCTTNGDAPTVDPSLIYDGAPLTISSANTVKAIAAHTGFLTSDIATFAIAQVETPTIQNNGSNAISITSATPGATIYYTTDGSTPTTSSTEYIMPLTDNVSNVTIKAIAVKKNMLPSEVGSGLVKLKCASPVITRDGMSFTLSCRMPTDATLYYAIGGGPETQYNNSPVTLTLTSDQLPVTVTAVAKHSNYYDSESANFTFIKGEGTASNPYLIYGVSDFIDFVTDVNNGTTASKCYKLGSDVSASGTDAIATEFTGTFDGDGYTISSLGHALFNSVNGGVVKNVILDNVDISSGTNVGAICNEAKGTTRIYNCGILSGSVGGSKKVGGLVGLLDGEARVINCFSYANITNGEDKGGIVGYNKVTSTQSSLTTMVMNCMFYGDIVDGNTIAPIYGGTEINNVAGGLNNYNYYRYRSRYSKEKKITKYNRALAMEEKFITRFERYRLLLNSNKKLAAKYASVITSDPSTTITVNPDDMAKWVLETADRSITGRNPYPYPILKAQRYYPSIINYDAKNAPDSTTVGRNHGGKLGRTLSITIATSKSDGGQTWPKGASITTTGLTLQRTDKDFDRFNYNYDKVQLPYYNDIGEGNYTGNRVVTGWKITSITGGNDGTYTESDSWGGYNFADRHCTKKDKYEINKRVFSQGAYWDVPEGVTAITIEPYWAIANYVSDGTYDVVYDKDYNKKDFTPFGTQYSNDSDIDIYGDGNNQKVYTSIANAIADFDNENKTVYDQAVVLVGNLHQYADPTNNDIPYTVMSIDMNHDNEPDYSYICSHDNRKPISPIRFDFLNVMGIAEAQLPKLTGNNDRFRNVSIFNLKGWFEITNTCVVNFSQFEYDNSNGAKNAVVKSEAPLILLGGTYEQFVSTQMGTLDYTTPKTKYIHIGGNAWFAKFGNGTHSDGKYFTPHVPISVTGGDYDEFYLSGTYQPNIENMQSDKAECYVSGGRFGDMAGASLEAIQGDVRWQIDWADITNFYGGGVNANNPITGDIRVDMTRSHVGQYCGGPKFGDMSPKKIVTTNATDCEFGTFFGAGYGGNSYNRVKYRDVENGVPDSYQGLYTTDRGKYFDGSSTNAYDTKPAYGKKGKGVATDFDYEFFIWSSGVTGARFYVQFVSFSLARTNNVTSNLTDCTINENFYGGGSLGKVNGTATSTLDGCTVKGNVFGGGYSATLPKIAVRNTPAFVTGKVPSKNINIGMFEEGEIAGTDDYEWKHVDSMPANGDPGMESTSAGNFVYTDEDLTTLGQVGTVNLTITNTTVDESVYGGGEESGVGGDTEVIVNSGSIGAEGRSSYGYRYGNVYGGGKGKIDNEGNLAVNSKDDLDAGLVKGNTSVTINGTKETTKIVHNVYGGGAVGSVGTFTRDDNGNPTACADNTGQASVTINGGTIGHDRKDSGMVNGSSRGWEGNPVGSFLDQLAWVNNASVVIGDATTSDEDDKGPSILGSVYGGGENGHNYNDGNVTINKGTIGNAKESANEYDCGNVYGAGCGTDTYWIDANGNESKDEGEEHHNQKAGLVRGNTTVTVNGGNVLRNIYGGGSMGSVGNDDVAESGKATINIYGGTIGRSEDSEHGHIFGGPKGNLSETEFSASVRETLVNINPHPTDASKPGADVKGSVFGGGEAGIVKESVTVNMKGGQVHKDVYGGGALADTQTSNWDASANNGAGDWAKAEKSALYTTTVSLTGGVIGEEVFGGALGRKEVASKPAVPAEGVEGEDGYKPGLPEVDAVDGIAALVYGDVLVELNGTETDNGDGTKSYNDNCVVKGSIFGCNNQNGSPKGKSTVHIYKTEDWTGHEKANHKYNVLAVYGGGNLSAYEPADLTNATTDVIIDGCDLTSIQQVYGGGNAASTPATKVTVNGTYEIEELFGGGNGKDKIVVGGREEDNPGANVGFKDYSAEESIYDTKEKRTTDTELSPTFISKYVYGTGKASVNIYGGTIHRVFGGSNTKGNVRETAVTLLDENTGCQFCVDEAYGGGKSAEMDAEAKLLMACIPGLESVYGGAEAADVHGDVTLNITNGTFDRVFGGNNKSGTIGGDIQINIEETGCKPIVIGELYGGGNLAGYSIYGFKQVTEGEGSSATTKWVPIERADDSEALTGDNVHKSPVVNVKSFTSIGAIYGGGYGTSAVMVGSPTVNINEVVGSPTTTPTTGDFDENKNYKGKELNIDDHKITLPSHQNGKIGAIGQVFGGGNAAKVIGDTHVNVGTLGTIDFVTKASGETGPQTGVPVVGVDIRGNVYGGGNNAEVTGDTNVTIGKKATP